MAFGGGCHWCTEAVFQSLKGVIVVEQGFVASVNENSSFSEAVIVHYDPDVISLPILTEVHLLTHNSTSQHSMRKKYRSAVYVYSGIEIRKVKVIFKKLQSQFNEPIITEVLFFKAFKPSEEQFKNYYFNNPKKPFCRTFIEPKLKMLLQQFPKYVDGVTLDD
ncbi:peptide-methionine (S)-S-oxide reductase [Lacinutrix neustonica]|uniref:peptide-methionine (S)-S-oxide reductase n=1 Tax=Lacinutrix neustonica TaxID=2980107 RepID=A0A9E8SCW5_9FLAO|nr:peptide-methionine (S)-S-oxide reductase [Lacinutrix neustonica]WAC01788.1 peptide-methionine (S)-S-oxide reductase [Lacinutrix neustonica]